MAEAVSSTCRKEVSALMRRLVHPLPRAMQFGRRAAAGASATGTVAAAKWTAARGSPA